jgi:hypothetical protein
MAIESYETVQITDPQGKTVTVNKIERELKDYEARGYKVPSGIYAEIKKASKQAEKDPESVPMHDGQIGQAQNDAMTSSTATPNPTPAADEKTAAQKAEDSKPGPASVQTAPPSGQGAAAATTAKK